MDIELDTTSFGGAKIKVIGVGGGGGNAINNMIARGLSGVDFLVANTDKQALDHSKATIKIPMGSRGLGAGANPEVAKKAVEESSNVIKEALKGADMLFVTAGMGGGTGTGAAPTIAKIGQELGALVVGIVTKPFVWEGRKRIHSAEEGINELRQYVDALIVIQNQRLLEIIEKKTTFMEAFLKVDEVLYNATRGIADIISCYGQVNVDFADVRTIMKGMGDAIMGIGNATGENRAIEATKAALNSPLLDGVSIQGAKGVLVNVTGGSDLTMHEISEAVSLVEQAAGGDVNLIHGVVYNPEPMEGISVTVVATGFKKESNETRPLEVKTVKNEPLTAPEPTSKRDIFGEEKITPIFDPKNSNRRNSAPSVKNIHQAADNKYRIPDSCPKGEKALKDLDKPAFERRNSETMYQNPVNGPEVHRKAESAINRFVEPRASEDRRPTFQQNAFLRKMLDF
eukprot:TRINITY_DN6457_c0_g1_i1.p2 TRINITY_DN6457_c0_g1~~TRINITY_DN6457_c0_g1_i1.p2  ORF type:complete len:456 (-),score=-5.63 TRINITY_DN6457_c0_g1_i1:34-1401(-)